MSTEPLVAPAVISPRSSAWIKTAIHDLRIAAKIMRQEAATWEDGFAVNGPGEKKWDDNEYGWAHIRCIKLTNAADKMDKLTERLITEIFPL